MASKIKKIKTEWDLSPLLKGPNDPYIKKEQKEIEKAYDKFAKKWQKNKDYLKKPEVLKKALDEYNDLGEKYNGSDGKAGYYFWLMSTKHSDDPNIKAKSNQIQEFEIKQINKIEFFILSLQKLEKKNREKLFKSKKLEKYGKFLSDVNKTAKFSLEEEVEKILLIKSPLTFGNWVKMRSALFSKETREIIDEDGKKRLKNYSEITSLMSSSNKKTRDSAAKAFNDILDKLVDVAEHEFNSVLQNKKINDQLRGFSDQWEQTLVGHNIDRKDAEQMIGSVVRKYKISNKYYSLKAKLLGLKKLQYHERSVEVGKVEKKIEFKDAISVIGEAFLELDKSFFNILKRFAENGQIDVYPKKGKTSSQYCSYHNKNQPVYIQLNYSGKLDSLRTIAHEMGHGINDEMMRVQPNIYFSTPVSTAEVASTFMEDFVFQKLLEKADDEERLSLMMSKLNDDVSTIFRQVASHLFEYQVHEEFRKTGYISKEKLGELFKKYMSQYMGKSVEQSPGSENWWAYWPHLRNGFYNYTYASGLLISKALQRKVKEDPKHIEKVKEFLSKGSSDSPKNILKAAGVDISKKETWESGLKEVEDLLKETEKLAKKLGKI